MGRIGHDQRCARLKAKTSDYKHEKTIWRFAGIIALSIDYCDRCVLRWPRNLTGQQPLTTAQPHRTGAGKQLEMVRDVANFSRGFHGFVGLGKSLEKNTRIDSRKNCTRPRNLEMMRRRSRFERVRARRRAPRTLVPPGEPCNLNARSKFLFRAHFCNEHGEQRAARTMFH